MLNTNFKPLGCAQFVSGLLICGLSLDLFAQGAPAANVPVGVQATSVLLEQAKAYIEADNPEALLPYLKELLVRMEGNTDADAQKVRSFCMYQTAVCQMQLKQFESAAESFESFIKEYPKDSLVPVASLQVAESYAMGGKWADVERFAGALLDSRDLDPAQRFSAKKIYAEALFNQGRWKDATVPLLDIFEASSDPKQEAVRSGSAVMLVTCYAKAGDFDNLFKFLPYCGEGVRQDAGLNMALVESGDVKLRRAEYQDALVLYRMVFRKAELLEYGKDQIAKMQAELKEPYVAKMGSLRSAYDEKQRNLQMQINRIAAQQKSISEGANYDLDIDIRIAQCYSGMKRPWVAYAAYNRIFTEFPKETVAEEARFFAIGMLIDLQEWDRAIADGLGYIQQYPKGLYFDEVTLNVTQASLQIGKVDQAQEIALKALKMSPDHRFIDQMKYLVGYIHFQKIEYSEALSVFEEVSKKWPESAYHEACDYWMAMCKLFLGQFNEAVAAFDAYLTNKRYAPAEFAEDATYRLGIAQYGAGDFPASEKVFRRFIQEYPESKLISEAYSMLGDLRGAEGDLDTALGFYSKGLQSATSIEQINYAVFQSAKTYELKQDYQAIVFLMESYIAERGAEGNFAGAGFWIGKAYKAMGDYNKALDTYIETVVKFGNRLENDDVDLILRELVKEYQSEESANYRKGLTDSVKSAIADAQAKGESILRLRLDTLLVSITEGPDRDRYVDGMLAKVSLNDASPITLQLMAQEALRRGNTEKVHQVYVRFKAAFDESELMLDMMNLEVEALLKDKRYDDVVNLAEEITNRFGYRVEVGKTRLMKADAYRGMKKYDEAIATYKELFAVRDWRGPLTPQALYWIGVCNEDVGKTEEAFAFFQRVYVLYEGYTEWVAKAYEGSVRCLRKLGRTDDIIRTYQEMLSKEAVAATPEGVQARLELSRLVPAGGKQ